MSRINHACGRCGHRAELHEDHGKLGATMPCSCCAKRTFDSSGPVERVDTFDSFGNVEQRHYAPGERRPIGGPPFSTHSCEVCHDAA